MAVQRAGSRSDEHKRFIDSFETAAPQTLQIHRDAPTEPRVLNPGPPECVPERQTDGDEQRVMLHAALPEHTRLHDTVEKVEIRWRVTLMIVVSMFQATEENVFPVSCLGYLK